MNATDKMELADRRINALLKIRRNSKRCIVYEAINGVLCDWRIAAFICAVVVIM